MRCYPCSIGRENVCANIAIIGAHVDGALQERLRVPASQVFAVGDMAPAVTAFVEPTSIGVRTVVRARVEAGDRVVVLGAGPIGQAVCLAAGDLGAAVLMADVVPERLEHARAMGAAGGRLRRRGRGGRSGARVGRRRRRGGAHRDDRRARRWCAARSTSSRRPAGWCWWRSRTTRSACRSWTSRSSELDVLGVSCCNAGEFAAAVDLVRRNEDAVARLITDEFAFERAPEALRLRRRRQRRELMKAVIQRRALAGSRFIRCPTAIAMWQSSRPSHLAREVQEPVSAPREGIPLHV